MNKLLPALALLVIALLAVQCKKEGCTDEAATNYNEEAKKDDGTCVYPEPDPREPYLGSYTVTDSAFIFGDFSEETTYVLTVATNGSTGDTIYLNNLWNDGADYYAILSGDFFSIPAQQVSGPYEVTGNGSILGDLIEYETSGDAYENRGMGEK